MNRYKNCTGGALQGVEGGAREAGRCVGGTPCQGKAGCTDDTVSTQCQHQRQHNTTLAQTEIQHNQNL